MDEVVVDGVKKQVDTDIVLMHRQFVPNGKVYTDLVFDDKGMGGLVEASGDVLFVEEFLVKHLHKSSSGICSFLLP